MKTFEINKDNLTRLSKNIKKKLKKENINIEHNKLLNILASSFGYHDFNDFNNKSKKVEVLDLSHEKSFHSSRSIVEELKNNQLGQIQKMFVEIELAKTICIEISLAFELELLHPQEYFLDINSIINELASIYKNEQHFYEINIFSKVLPYMYNYFDNKETNCLFIKKLLKEIPDEYTKNLFICTLNDWSLFYVRKHFKDDLNYQHMSVFY